MWHYRMLAANLYIRYVRYVMLSYCLLAIRAGREREKDEFATGSKAGQQRQWGMQFYKVNVKN